MINRLFSSTLASSPQQISVADNQVLSGSQISSKHSAAAMIIPFRLNPKVLIESDGSSIMMECRIFNETILDVRQCCNALTRIFYLFFGSTSKNGYVGNISINSTEATSIFFCITKAFQSKDVNFNFN